MAINRSRGGTLLTGTIKNNNMKKVITKPKVPTEAKREIEPAQQPLLRNESINSMNGNGRVSNLFELIGFFQVPGKDEDGFVWHDKDGNQIHGHEYHDEKGEIFNSKTLKKRGVKKVEISIPRYRQAETDADFELIYRRELKKNHATDDEIFQKDIADKVSELLEYETTLPVKERDAPRHGTRQTASNFLKWLDQYVASKRQIPDPASDNELVKIDDRELLKYIFDEVDGYKDGIALFAKIENSLLRNKYIDKERNWKKPKTMLVAFIASLSVNGILRKKRRDEPYFNKKARSFFENRYGKEISQQSEPNKFKKAAKRHLHDFTPMIQAAIE